MKFIIYKKILVDTIEKYNKIGKVFFPIKVNSNKKLLKIIDPYISGYEVESFFHALMLIKEMKIDPKRIIYSSTLLTDEDIIERLLMMGIKNYIIDDIYIYNKLAEKANEALLSIILRIDVLEILKEISLRTKWGASFTDICYLKNKIRINKHNFLGISFYLPQECSNIQNFEMIINYIANKTSAMGIKVLDIGGGIKPGDLKTIVDIVDFSFRKKPEIIIEPGRHLLNPSIDLIVRIVSIRIKHNNTFLFIDCGIYSGLIDCIIKKRRFKIITAKTSFFNEYVDYYVCGNTSDVSDVIGIYSLPSELKIGDELIIKECGAYCSEMSTNFCKNKRADYYIVDS